MNDYNTVKDSKSELAINWDRRPHTTSDEKNDTKFVKMLFCCGRYIGVSPLNVDIGKAGRICIKILTVGILLVTFAYQYISILYKAAVYNSKHYIITHALTSGLWCLSEYLFIAACFLSSNIYRQGNWKVTLQLFDQMELLLLQYNFDVKKKLYLFYVEFIFIYVICISLHCFQSYNLKSLGWNPFYFIGWRTAHFYMMFLLILLVNLTHLLKRRYNVLNKQVEYLLYNKNDFILKLKEVVKLYKLLGNLVEQINTIFGAHIYLFVQVSIVSILFAVIDVLAGKDNDLGASSATRGQFAMTILFPLIYTISLVVLVMSCDSLEKSGKKIIKTCYMLHESVSNELIKEELFLLASYAEQWKPTLSAAGFYDLNQTTLSILFEAIITYLVIIIQFNLALA